MAITRRMFVGGSAAAIGAAAAAPAFAHADTAGPDEQEAAVLGTPVLVRILDPKTGDLEVLVGESAVVVNDARFARTLARTIQAGS